MFIRDKQFKPSYEPKTISNIHKDDPIAPKAKTTNNEDSDRGLWSMKKLVKINHIKLQNSRHCPRVVTNSWKFNKPYSLFDLYAPLGNHNNRRKFNLAFLL